MSHLLQHYTVRGRAAAKIGMQDLLQEISQHLPLQMVPQLIEICVPSLPVNLVKPIRRLILENAEVQS